MDNKSGGSWKSSQWYSDKRVSNVPRYWAPDGKNASVHLAYITDAEIAVLKREAKRNNINLVERKGPMGVPFYAPSSAQIKSGSVSTKVANDVPVEWKSSPDHPVANLVYVTNTQAKLLKKLDIHGSGVDKHDHYGPDNVPSYQGDGGFGYGGGGSDAGMGSDFGSTGSFGTGAGYEGGVDYGGGSNFGTTGSFGHADGSGGVGIGFGGSDFGGGFGGDAGSSFTGTTDNAQSNQPKYVWNLPSSFTPTALPPVYTPEYIDYRTTSPLSISNYGRGIFSLPAVSEAAPVAPAVPAAPAPAVPVAVPVAVPAFTPLSYPNPTLFDESNSSRIGRIGRGLRSLRNRFTNR